MPTSTVRSSFCPLTCTVTATNGVGNAQQVSAPVTVSVAAPVNTVPPSGTTTPVTVLGPNPIIRTRIDVGPVGT